MAEGRDAGVDPRFDPEFQRGYAPAQRAEPQGEPAPSGHNPFRLALLAASIVSIGGAGLMLVNGIGEDVFYGGFSGQNQELLFRSQLIAALPIPLLTGGLLGLILWLAIGAVSHRDDVDD